MKEQIDSESANFITEHTSLFNEHLEKIKSLDSQGEDGPFSKIKIGLEYSFNELSEIFDWPLEDGFAIFLNQSRNPWGKFGIAKLIKDHGLKLEVNNKDLYVFTSLEEN